MDTILFDLDGTLLPMDQHEFMKVYFEELTKKCAAYGFDPTVIPSAVWAGTEAMVKNDGSATNETVFWTVFSQHMGRLVLKLKPALEMFYEEEFNRTRTATQPNPLARQLIQHLRSRGYTLVLASNPVFPANAYRTRLSWIGLTPEDFDLLTSYETFHYCKPNPLYYQEILQRIDKRADQCLMVGNDVEEDGCAKTLGLNFHLLTDNLINSKNEQLSLYQTSSFQEFFDWAKASVAPVSI